MYASCLERLFLKSTAVLYASSQLHNLALHHTDTTVSLVWLVVGAMYILSDVKALKVVPYSSAFKVSQLVYRHRTYFNGAQSAEMHWNFTSRAIFVIIRVS